MNFDTKIKIVLRNDLKQWEALNVTAFLISGIAGTQDIIGEPYLDKSGIEYLGMSKQPILIYSATSQEISELLKKALTKEVVISIFTEELFKTYNDIDNRAIVSQFYTDELNLVGIAIRGKKNHADKLLKGFNLHE